MACAPGRRPAAPVGQHVVELWNGQWRSDLPWQADDEPALAEWGRSLASAFHEGRWQPAIGNSDTHLAGQVGVPRTVVPADELSADAVLAGIRAGHSRLAARSEVELSFAVSCSRKRAGW